MASSRVCSINTCKRSSLALCNCCQQYLCITHLTEHSDLLNAQLTPLADEINQLSDQLNKISLLRPEFFAELDKWRQQAHRTVDLFYEQKKQELEELVKRQRKEQNAELDRLRKQVNDLIQELGATQEHIDSINDSVLCLQQQIKQLQLPQLTLSPLIIDDRLVAFRQKTSRPKSFLPLPPPCQTTKLGNRSESDYIAASDNHLLAIQDSKVWLFDRQLIVRKMIPWTNDSISAIIWSRSLAQFLLVTYFKIFTLNEETMAIGQILLNREDHRGWWRGTCSDDNLFLSTASDGPSIYKYTLCSLAQSVKEYQTPFFCKENEVIRDLSSNQIALALVISDREDIGHLDLFLSTTLERYWSFGLGNMSAYDRVRCCSLMKHQWLIVREENSKLLHISADGKPVNKQKYHSTPWHAVQFGDDALAILSKEGVNLHQLS